MKASPAQRQMVAAATEMFRTTLLQALQDGSAEVKEDNSAAAVSARRTRNGVTEPGEAGTCRKIWDLLDNKVKAGVELDITVVRKLARKHRLNENNTVIEFYRWKKFNDSKKH